MVEEMIPPNPKEINPMLCVVPGTIRASPKEGDVGMKNTKDLSIEVGMFVGMGFSCVGTVQHHDITLVGICMKNVLVSSHVVGCEVDPHDLVPEDAIILKDNGSPLGSINFGIGEPLELQNAWKEVLFQLWDEVLWSKKPMSQSMLVRFLLNQLTLV